MLGFGLSITKSKAAKPAPPYQKWPGLPDSPLLTADYPHQIVTVDGGGNYKLLFTKGDFYKYSAAVGTATQEMVVWMRYKGVDWYSYTRVPAGNLAYDNVQLIYANTDIYTDSSLTTVAFPKNV